MTKPPLSAGRERRIKVYVFPEDMPEFWDWGTVTVFRLRDTEKTSVRATLIITTTKAKKRRKG